MESIRPLKENPELAKELADILLPYIMESVEYKFIVETREKLNALVEAVSRLQEAVNRNSEDIRAMQQDIKLLHEDNKKLWEAVNKNSEDIKLLHEDNKKLWEAIDSLTRSVQRLEVVVGSFTGRAGVYMERTMLELYKEALRLHGIDVSKVRSAKIVDQAGVYQKGKEFQVDIIEEDGVTYLFEIKNYGDEDVLEQVETRRRILEAMGRNVKVFIVANIIEDKVKAEAEKEGIAVVAGHVVESPR